MYFNFSSLIYYSLYHHLCFVFKKGKNIEKQRPLGSDRIASKSNYNNHELCVNVMSKKLSAASKDIQTNNLISKINQ